MIRRRSRGIPLGDFGRFYAENADRVLLYLTRRCLDPEVAVDLMAESFARAFEARGDFRGSTREQAEAWVFGIARNQLATYFRRGRIERHALVRLRIEVPQLEPDELERLIRVAGLEELRSTVNREFDRLTPDQRAAVRLRVLDERPYREVAECLDVPEHVARARVSRGLRRLAGSIDRAALMEGGS
jgi:RNA polymerase sigma factor (sigma-70 family)